MSEPRTEATNEELLTALTNRRWIAVAAWVLLISTVFVLATIEDAWGDFTPNRVALGAYFASLFLLPITLYLTHPTKPEFDALKFIRRSWPLLVGERTLKSIALSVIVTYAVISEYRGEGFGPVDTTIYTVIALTGLTVSAFDLWIRTPRAVDDPTTDRPLLENADQEGLVDRGYAVSVWIVPIYVLSPLMLFAWGPDGFTREIVTTGATVGAAAGIIAIGVVRFRARGNYSERVFRYSRHTAQPIWRQMIRPGLIGVAGFTVAGFAIDGGRFMAFMIAISIMCVIGLLATVVDRWILVPRLLRTDRGDPPEQPAALTTA